MRSISAPEPRLKVLQQRLASLLYEYLDELEASPRRRTLSHGFVRGRSIITNAHAHRGRRHVLNVDLSDFFPSINLGRIRGVLMKDRRFLLHERVATLIAQIACRDGVLPQGSPCSPVMSNIVGRLLDIRMARLAREHGCRYTRYADDLTFSTNEREFPAAMAVATGSAGDCWAAGTDLVHAITKAGYVINPAKTRLQSRQSRQTVTGLVVNQTVNVRSEYYRTVRSMCAQLFSTGSYYRILPGHFTGGAFGDPDVKEDQVGLAPLQGMVEHIYQVRNRYDDRDPREKKAHPTAIRKLYHKLLFYRNFVALEKPLIIPEGKTDTIYLKAAIERLPAFHHRLGDTVDGRFKHALDFQRFSSKVHDILQLGGGTGDFLFFMKSYRDNMAKYHFRAMRQPVILLIDNDSGAENVFKEALRLGVAAIAIKSSLSFYRLVENLYLVKTPELGASGKSCIENLFDPLLLKEQVDGLEFDPAKKHKADGKYGKQIFAEKVVKPMASTIDFAGFAPLIERIVAVLDDYAAIKSPTP
jgi:RNA-directed DNA polymerase